MDAGEVVCPKKEFTASAPGRRVPTLCEDKVSANTASSVPKCYKKSDRSQDAHRWYPDMPN